MPNRPRERGGLKRKSGPQRMRTIVRVLAWSCLAAAAAPTVSEAQDANIPDENLREAIETALGKASGAAITEAEMAELTSLRAQYVGIEDLTGLEHATGLTELYLSYNDIEDLSPLSDLESLEVLWVGHNRISDVAPLASVTSLVNLGFLNNDIEDLSPLSGLHALESLDLRENRVSDLAPLTGLDGLVRILLNDNGIANLAPLEGLTSLEWLDLSNNAITDLSTLSNLPELRILYLSNNGIADLSPLAGLGRSLRSLYLASNAISDLAPLAGLTELGSLDLSDNRISDASALQAMGDMWDLDLSDNRISDLAPLAGMPRMEFLRLNDNAISDLLPLAGMAELYSLYLSGNRISDLMPLEDLDTLTILGLSDNEISDLSALSGMTSMGVLYLAGNDISDLSALSGMSELSFLYLSDNAISDLSPLSELPELSILDLAGNAISDLSPLSGMSLYDLDLSDNQVSDLSGLAGMRFVALDLADNQISDLSPLSTVLFATTLDLSRNEITDFSPLPLVYRLYVSDSGLSDMTTLSDMAYLNHLDISNNRIENLSLDGLGDLESLDAAANEIVDAAPAAQLPNAEFLYLGGNAIADVAALAVRPESLQRVSLWRNPLDAGSVLTHIPALEERGVRMTGGGWRVPFFPSPGEFRQGFVRVVSSAVGQPEYGRDASDKAWVYASDEDNGPARLLLGARIARHFNADDLVAGNPDKGLRSALGSEAGDTLDVYASGDLDVLSYVRTADGFVTSMHDTAPWLPADHTQLDALRGRAVAGSGRAAGGHFVPIFNPASNAKQRSMLRLVNAGGEDVDVTVHGVDDLGVAAGPVRLTLAADSTRTLTAADLESGDPADLSGSLGDGEGKWRLVVSAGAGIHVMNLMSSPTGHLANLSTASDGGLVVPMLPAASHPTRQGFVRVANLGAAAGTAEVRGYDDEGASRGPLTLRLPAGGTVHFNSDDWESGNADKGLDGAAGVGEGAWRLEFESDLDLLVSAYVRTSDGFLTSMHDLVRRNTCAAHEADGGPVAARSARAVAFRPCRDEFRVPLFNPASNRRQVGSLRLVNRGDADAAVAVFGVDDDGAERGPARLALPAGAARTLTSLELESGDADGVTGALGDGTGKWELRVFIADAAAGDVMVMSLLESPTGHLTNLSTWPDEELRAP